MVRYSPSTPLITPTMSFTHSTRLPDGQYPYAGLTLVGNTLYGTTANGGTPNLGTIFDITISNSSTPASTTSTTTIPYSGGGGSSGGGFCPNYPVCNYSGTGLTASTTTILPTASTTPSIQLALNASYTVNISANTPTSINVTGAGATIILITTTQTPANITVTNVTNSIIPLQSYTLLIALNISTTSANNITMGITLKYPCSISSNTIYPYELKGNEWVQIAPFTVNASSCTVTFAIPADPIVGLFYQQQSSSSTILPTIASTTIQSTIPTTIIQTQQPSNAHTIELAALVIVVLAVIISLIYYFAAKNRKRR